MTLWSFSAVMFLKSSYGIHFGKLKCDGSLVETPAPNPTVIKSELSTGVVGNSGTDRVREKDFLSSWSWLAFIVKLI